MVRKSLIDKRVMYESPGYLTLPAFTYLIAPDRPCSTLSFSIGGAPFWLRACIAISGVDSDEYVLEVEPNTCLSGLNTPYIA